MGLRGIGSKSLFPRLRQLQTGIAPPTKEPPPKRKPGRPRKDEVRSDIQGTAFDESLQPWDKPKTRCGRVIAFCEALHITSGTDAGKKVKLRPWQRQFIKQVYQEDGLGHRAVRTAVLSMGRKNGKSFLAAMLALCHLAGPEAEPRGEIYSCANDRFQASRIFNEMVALILRNDWLATRLNVIRFRKEIENLLDGSLYAALTAEAKTKMGLSPSFVVYDELGQATGRELYDAMDSALGARREPLLLVISTQAADDFAPMSQLVDYGSKIKEGVLEDPAFHLTLYTAPIDADPWVRETWDQANPALADFRSLEDIERLAKQAKRMPARENAFRNLILNQRVAAEARFMNASVWQACGGEVDIPQGVRVYAGLDLGATRDLSALVIVYENPIDGVWHVRPYFWLPGNIRERALEEKLPYEDWVRDGYLKAIGVSTDPEVIARKIAEINGVNKIMGLAYDRWHIADLKRELDKIGCTVPLIEHGQGYRDMASAVNTVERLAFHEKLRHGMHPVLRMCVTNAVITRDPANNRKFDKAKSNGRIDGLVAMAMALNAVNKTNAGPVVDIEAMIA
jgi:phage terminase large subunit-like protein